VKAPAYLTSCLNQQFLLLFYLILTFCSVRQVHQHGSGHSLWRPKHISLHIWINNFYFFFIYFSNFAQWDRSWTSEAKDEARRWQLQKSMKEWFQAKGISMIQRGRKIMHTQKILAQLLCSPRSYSLLKIYYIHCCKITILGTPIVQANSKC
jgi:hypothetical protein